MCEEALKQGSVEMSIIKCLVLGIAGVGKTHLKSLLLSESTEKHIKRVSTGLADNPVKAFVGSVKSTLAGVDEKDSGIWEVLDEENLIGLLANAYKMEHLPLPPTAPTVTQTPPHPAMHQQSSRSVENPVSKPDVNVLSTPSTELPSSQPVEQRAPLELPREDRLHDNQVAESVNSQFIKAFKNAIDKKLQLKVTLVHFIDSGGQPQFLELLPAFVQDVSAILFAVNLSENLDHCPEIGFYDQDGNLVGKSYTSPSSHKQVLEQCVRAAHARDVHPYLFVVGTHRDEKHKCSENKKDKDEIIKNFKPLIRKSNNEIIWDVKGYYPEDVDKNVANDLRQAIVKNCRMGISPLLPLKWFALEMQIRVSAKKGVLSLERCRQLAKSLGIDEEGLKAALLHMVKYNLFLWYHNVPGLREVVFSDPQVILKIITALVERKHELVGSNITGLKAEWCSMFKDHALVNHNFLSDECFKKKHLFDGDFTVDYFRELMCHLCIMVRVKDDEYLMPALLDPLSTEKIRTNIKDDVDPLLVCFPNNCVPHGVFSFLVAFLQKEGRCTLVEEKGVPTCLHSNCVSFRCMKFPAKFTIVDSVTCIEVHLTGTKACPRIRKLIHDGIQHSTELLHYNSCKDLKDGFVCTNQSCKGVAIPYEEDPSNANCKHCSCDMPLTTRHTDWLAKEGEQGMCWNVYILHASIKLPDQAVGMV